MTFFAPTRAYNDAVARAVERDMVDEERLEHFAAVVGTAIDAIMRDLHPLSHPDAKWMPDDLMDVLQGQLVSIQHEQRRLRGPLVLEDE